MTCPSCDGKGFWYSECCDGSQCCSCNGQPVPMGKCLVCGGTGIVVEGQYNPKANSDSLKGLLYLGFSPLRGK